MDRKKLIKIPMNGELELLERFVGKQQPKAVNLFISFKSQFRTMGFWQYDSIVPAESLKPYLKRPGTSRVAQWNCSTVVKEQ